MHCRVGLVVWVFFFCSDLGFFCAVGAFCTPFFSHLLLSDGDALWRECAWEKYSCFCVSRLTDPLSCVRETEGG